MVKGVRLKALEMDVFRQH